MLTSVVEVDVDPGVESLVDEIDLARRRRTSGCYCHCCPIRSSRTDIYICRRAVSQPLLSAHPRTQFHLRHAAFPLRSQRRFGASHRRRSSPILRAMGWLPAQPTRLDSGELLHQRQPRANGATVPRSAAQTRPQNRRSHSKAIQPHDQVKSIDTPPQRHRSYILQRPRRQRRQHAASTRH